MRKIKGVLVVMLLFASITGVVNVGNALDQPFPVTGNIKNSSGSYIPAGVSVTVKDITRGTQMSVTTQSNGYYQADLFNLPECADGDIIEVSCSYAGEDNAKTFTLDVSDTSKQLSFFLVGAPDVTTDAATGISSNSATLHGELTALKDLDSGACDVWFEWGTTTSYGHTTTKVTKYSPASFSASLSGLSPDKTYHFRAVAQNSRKTSYGDDMSFHTSSTSPSVTTNTASNIGYATATLNGYLNAPGASNCDVWFVYDTVSHASIGDYAFSTSKETKTSASSFSRTISGLAVQTTYYFRAVAKNDDWPAVMGTERSFTTQIMFPSVVTGAALNISSTAATLSGELTDIGGDDTCQVWFEYGETSSYGYATEHLNLSAEGTFEIQIDGLEPGTTYHFRAVAQNSRGVSYGDDGMFNTSAVMAAVETGAIEYAIILRANVTSLGGDESGEAWFEYWEEGLENESIQTEKKTITQEEEVEAVITGLNENATYFYRAAVENSQGISYGTNLSFKMFSLPRAPSIVTVNATPSYTSALLSANVTSFGDSNSCYVWFEYWNGERSSTSVKVVNTTGLFYEETHGLNEGTRYYYRAIAVGENGRISYGGVKNFTTNISENHEPVITLISPENGSHVDISVSLVAEVYDADNDSLSITFYWENGSAIHTVNGTGGMVSVGLHLAYASEYGWYVVAHDGKSEVTSATRHFSTIERTVVNFSHSYAFVNEAVFFNDTSIGDIEQWFWDFGDGNVSHEKNATHIYAMAGTYTVNLSVIDTYANTRYVTKEVEVWQRGDANMDGAINALDITRIKRIHEGLDDMADYPPADANNDGVVNDQDVALVIQKILGLA